MSFARQRRGSDGIARYGQQEQDSAHRYHSIRHIEPLMHHSQSIGLIFKKLVRLFFLLKLLTIQQSIANTITNLTLIAACLLQAV